MTDDTLAKRRTSPALSRLDSSAPIQAVDRALGLLELLSSEDDGARLCDLAERSGLPASTVHRLLTTMAERRFVQFSAVDGNWRIGQTSHRVGAAFTRRGNLAGTALPLLRQLRDKARETVNLAIADSDEIVILSQVESREIVRTITRPGGRLPMTSSGLGKAILAHYPVAEVERIVQHFGLPRFTSRSIVRPGDLTEDLARIRDQGFALDDEQAHVGLRCVAAALFDLTGDPVGAISLSGPTTRLSDARIAPLGRLVAETALAITGALGGAPSAQDAPTPA